jgi:hypothetical protein
MQGQEVKTGPAAQVERGRPVASNLPVIVIHPTRNRKQIGSRVRMPFMVILAQAAERAFYDFMIPIPGTRSSVHVVVLTGGVLCLLSLFSLIVAMLFAARQDGSRETPT